MSAYARRHRYRTACAAVLGGVVLVASAPAANAASVFVSGGVLTLRADAGDSGWFNLSAGLPGSGTLTVVTMTAPLTIGAGCGPPTFPAPGAAGQAECAGATTARVELEAAAGASVVPPPVPTTVVGSPMTDALYTQHTTTAGMTMYGMGGDDNLQAGGGPDHLDGGDGNDTLTSSIGEGQTLVGGPGDDDFYSTEDTVFPRIVCGTGRDDLFIDHRPGRFSLDIASCPPFLLDRFDPPPLRAKRDCTVRVPVRFSEPVRGRVRLLDTGGAALGSSRVARYRTTARLLLRLSPATYRRVRRRGNRGLLVLVAATLVDRSGERTSETDGNGQRSGGYWVFLRSS